MFYYMDKLLVVQEEDQQIDVESFYKDAEHLVLQGKDDELMSLISRAEKKGLNYSIFQVIAKAYALKDESGTKLISFILELAEKGILNSSLLFHIFKTAVETYISDGGNYEIISLISKFKEKISTISKATREWSDDLLSRVFDITFEAYILSYKRSIAEFVSLISKLKEKNPDYPDYLLSGNFKEAAKAYVLKDKSGIKLISFILELTKKRILKPLYLFDIFETAVETYISNGKNDDEIISLISRFKEKIPFISKITKKDQYHLLSGVFYATCKAYILSDKKK